MIHRRIFAAFFVFLPAGACNLDARKQAVNEIIQFALDSPFEILSVGEGDSYLAVADSALSTYNRIFDYLPKSDEVDSARYYYNQWMRLILTDASFSTIENLSYSFEADTLIAVIAVRRPELTEFNRTVVSRLTEIDTEALNARLIRAKRELQIRDTLILRVVAGPRVVAWSSAIHRRDSVNAGQSPPLPSAAVPDFAQLQPETVALRSAGTVTVEVPDPDPADSTIRFWVARNANIRVGPGMDFEVVTTRATGTALEADSLADGWYHVRADEGKVEGFIAASLVSLDSVAAIEAAEPAKGSGTSGDYGEDAPPAVKTGHRSNR